MPTPTPTPDPPSYSLVARIQSDGGGFFVGAASADLSLIAIGGYVSTEAGVTANERQLTMIDGNGSVVAKVDLGDASWAVAMTPDGRRTVAGSDSGNMFFIEGTTLKSSGRPIPGNGQLRGAAIRDDGRYAGIGGFDFTLHDLDAADPLSPVFVDRTTDQCRAVDFSADGRYVAWGGRSSLTQAVIGIYDIAAGKQIFSDSIDYPEGTNAEVRHLSISPDGGRMVAGDWANMLHYYVRGPSDSTWKRVETIDMKSRVYWTDMDAAGSLVVVGTQGLGVHLYEMQADSLKPLWFHPDSSRPIGVSLDGGSRYVSITRNGEYITSGQRGGGSAGGKAFVFRRDGSLVFSFATDAVKVGQTYLGPNNATPEVWFARISEDGTRIAFAGWSGFAYLYRRAN